MPTARISVYGLRAALRALLVAGLLVVAAGGGVAHAGRPGANGTIASGHGLYDAPVCPPLLGLALTDSRGTNRYLGTTGTPPEPSWSPDGTAFISRMFSDASPGPICPPDVRSLRLHDAGGGLLRSISDALPAARETFTSPAWSPLSATFAHAGPGGVWLTLKYWPVGPFVKISDDATVSGLSWSPDGTRLAFSSLRSGTREVWTMRSDGTNPVRLTHGGGERPEWSPDGSKILWLGPRGLSTVRPDGSDTRRVVVDLPEDVAGPSPIRSAVWSPDGTAIAVHRITPQVVDEIWLTNVDGSQPRLLTQGAGLDLDWGRVNRLPVAAFRYAPVPPVRGDTVTLTSESRDPDGPLTAIEWDLDGDGAYEADGEQVTVRLESMATRREIGLRVVDQDGAVAAQRQVIAVGNRRPSASLTYAPEHPRTGQPVTFKSTSNDPDGPLTSTQWDLDNDGAYDDGGQAEVSRRYEAPGSYPVALRVEDADGAVDVARADVIVGPRLHSTAGPPDTSVPLAPGALPLGATPRAPSPRPLRALDVRRTTLRRALLRGLAVRVDLRSSATVAGVARLRSAAARELKLAVLVAQGAKSARAGDSTLILRFTSKAKRRLRRLRSMRLLLTVEVARAGGRPQVVRRAITLRSRA